MKKGILTVALVLLAATSFAGDVKDVICPDGSCTILFDSQGRSIFGFGVRPTANQNLGITVGMPFYDGPTYQWYWYTGTGWTATLSAPLTGPLLFPNGDVTLPAIAFANEPDHGFFLIATNNVGLSINGTEKYRFAATRFSIATELALGTSSPNPDTFISRDGAANKLQLGSDAASPAAQTLKAADSTTSGNAGASFTISGGNGGGTVGAANGDVIIGSGLLRSDSFAITLTADAAMQYGSAVMVDAGTANRFDASTGAGTVTLGFLAGSGASVQGTDYPVIVHGIAYCHPTEDQAFTLAHFAIIGAAAGDCTDSAAISTIGKNLGYVLAAAPVSNTINPAGCTGGSGCINTALNTPNAGPAGQITLAADVAAQGWAVGDPVVYYNSGGATPTGLTDGGVYFLTSVATVNVTMAATKGGAVVVPTTQGNDATQYLQKLPRIVIALR